MNVFVLTTGRSGSTTFAKACSHIENYTSAHESKYRRPAGRLVYPDNHIEVDGRLQFFVGALVAGYPDAYYVNLKRDVNACAESWAARWSSRSMLPNWWKTAFYDPIDTFGGLSPEDKKIAKAQNMVTVMQANIAYSLLPIPEHRKITIDIDRPSTNFKEFWKMIGAQGDRKAALAEFGTRHNARK